MSNIKKNNHFFTALSLIFFCVWITVQSLQNCELGQLTVNSSQPLVLQFGSVDDISNDKKSVYQLLYDSSQQYKLYGQKTQITQDDSSSNNSITLFSVLAQINWKIVYISTNGGCLLIDNATNLLAFQTSFNTFTQTQSIPFQGNYYTNSNDQQRGNYISLRASQDCKIVQITTSTLEVQIFISSNLYSGVMPSYQTIFDISFTYGINQANTLYKYDGSQFQILYTFTNNENYNIPLSVIDKSASQILVLYSTDGQGDFSIVLYNYGISEVMAHKKFLSNQISGNPELTIANGDSFTALVYKHDSGLLYALSYQNNSLNQLGLDSSLNSKFAQYPLITITQAYILAYGSNQLNVFYIDQSNWKLQYLGNFMDINFIQTAESFYTNSTLPSNSMVYLSFNGEIKCSNGTNNNNTNSTNGTSNSTDNNSTSNSTDNNSTSNSTDNNSTSNSTDNNSTSNSTNNTDNNSTSNYTQSQIINIINNKPDKKFYTNGSNGEIIVCPTGCLNCSTGQTCTFCIIGYALTTAKLCAPCSTGCKNCSSTDPNTCFDCFLPLVLNTTTNLCQYNTCANANCQTCDQAGACTSCYDGYSLWNGDCKQCILGCNVCVNSLQNCDTQLCKDGYVYLVNNLKNIHQCVQCTVGCLSCQTANLDNCINCIPGYYPTLDYTKTPVSNTCLACMANCDTCLNAYSCQVCSSGYQVTSDGLRCVLQCISPCYTCSQNLPTKCLSCLASYVYDSSTQSCVPSLICNTTNSCISCPSSYVLSNKQCLKCNVADTNCEGCLSANTTKCGICAQYYYLNSISNTCQSCSTNCTTCFSSDSCSQCQAGSYLVKQYLQSTGYCAACESPCLTCYNKGYICLTCVSGYTLHGKKCKGSINVGWQVEINIDRSLYSSIAVTYNSYFLQSCSKIVATQDNSMIIDFIKDGSTWLNGTVTVSQTTASAISNRLAIDLVPGTLIQGFPIMGTTITINGLPTQESSSGNNYLPIILGLSIPLTALASCLIAYGVYRRRKRQSQQGQKQQRPQTKSQLINKSNLTQDI